MTGRIEARLKELKIELPDAAAPAANYVPYVITGNQLWIAGQIPYWNGELRHKGKVGATASPEDGAAAARLCALNIIAQAKAALGDSTASPASSSWAVSSTPRPTSRLTRRSSTAHPTWSSRSSATRANTPASPSAPHRCRATRPARLMRSSPSSKLSRRRPGA